jgi:hypothetical protein
MSTELKLLGALVLAGGALAAAPGIAARPAPSVVAVVDRTVICTRVPPSTVNVWASNPDDPVFFKGYLAVTSGPDSFHPLLYVRQQAIEGPVYPTKPGVFARIGTPGCVASRRSAPLTSAGLPGPPVQWGQLLKCDVAGGVVVHVRATVQSSGSWLKVSSLYRGSPGAVTEARLAVRNARTGKPLVYVTIDRQSRLRVWSAPACD